MSQFCRICLPVRASEAKSSGRWPARPAGSRVRVQSMHLTLRLGEKAIADHDSVTGTHKQFLGRNNRLNFFQTNK
eukprot:scaffold1093_cov107-Skeletonema_dohrnii-CCMP3373.AAC.1